MNFKDRNSGFTLIEIMVALTLSTVSLTAVYSAYNSQRQAHPIQEDVVEMQQNMRVAMYFMVRETRMAGYDPSGDSGASRQRQRAIPLPLLPMRTRRTTTATE